MFIHGVGTSSYLWQHVIESLRKEYRCVAIDLPLHGSTPADPGTDFSLPGLAQFVADCCDALGLDTVDVVANNTGGAVAQIFTARNSERVQTLTLTNCETHNNLPPKAFLPTIVLARLGLLAPMGPRTLRNISVARKRSYGSGFEDVHNLPEVIAQAWLSPLLGTRGRARQFQRWLTSLRARDLLAVEPALRRLLTPTLVVWGTDDVFFHRKWAYWLAQTIPGVVEVVEVPGGKLFFPFERAAELVIPLRRHLSRSESTDDGSVDAIRPARKFIPADTSLYATVTTHLDAAPDAATRLYKNTETWAETFPDTIDTVRTIDHAANWVEVEVHHRTAGIVPNTLIFISPTSVGLIERKPLYDGWFRNDFQDDDSGTRYVLSGWLVLRGWLRPLTPLLARYVRRRMRTSMQRFVLSPFAKACLHAED
ncbi:alpha/beta fold hydrolase [Nocardia sp. NPDC004260]